MHTKKQIYLTIDDSPSSSYRDNLDFLLKNKIPTVFFCIGNLMENKWSDLIFAIQNGYHIANHSYSHRSFSDLSIEEIREEILKTDDLIDVLYNESGVDRNCRYFRFPYGDKADGKYGYHFLSFEDAQRQKKSSFQNFIDKLNKFHPLAKFKSKHLIDEFKEKAFKTQQYLFDLGYVSADFDRVDHTFFHNLKVARDWSWTLDVGEWNWNKKKEHSIFLRDLLERLESEKPVDYRGGNISTASLKNLNSAELLLFHDREETNTFFKPVIEHLIDMDVEFLDPFVV